MLNVCSIPDSVSVFHNLCNKQAYLGGFILMRKH